MQIIKAEVIPMKLGLQRPFRMGGLSEITEAHHTTPTVKLVEITEVTAIFLRLETRQGQSAWGCTVAHPELTGEMPDTVVRECREGANLVPDLHPTNIEFSLDELESRAKLSRSAMCAFDMAFHDLLGLETGMPLYRILGGYRNRIQTSVTIPIVPMEECLEKALQRASQGFRMLKIKGGQDPAEDVRRVQAIHLALPDHVLRLDADGGYTVQDALDVARALENVVEMLEQPTPANDLHGLRQVKEQSPVPILADQSLRGPASALELAANQMADGLSIKLATCGGLRCARQIDAIARAAHMSIMVSCFFEPALLIAAGLSLALSSPNVRYGDLDGYLDLVDDPSRAGFQLKDGWLVSSEVPGLGYTVEIG